MNFLTNHFIIAEQNLRQPETYSDIIEILTEEQIIPPEVAKKIEKLPAVRNLLSHEYLIIEMT